MEVACLAVRLLHVNNRCTIQQLLQRIAQERPQRTALCSGITQGFDGLTGQPRGLQALSEFHERSLIYLDSFH